MDKTLTWLIDASPQRTQVTLAGDIGLDADFAPLLAALEDANSIELDVSGVRRLNSCGIREWINFIRDLSSTREVVLQRCSPAMVTQLNTLRNFASRAKVLSISAPYLCGHCGCEEGVVVAVVPGRDPDVSPRPCPVCHHTMEFDDVPEFYFHFLNVTSR